MNLYTYRYLFGLGMIFTLSFCTNPTTPDTQSDAPAIDVAATLDGYWMLYGASRNNKMTQTLEGVSFEFTDNQLITNLLGSSEVTGFSLQKDDIIKQSGGKMDTDYTIKYITADTLHLDTELQGYQFSLKLVRSEKE